MGCKVYICLSTGCDGNVKVIRIGSRSSELAMIQTHTIMGALKALYPDLTFEVVTMKTIGDKILDTALPKIGQTNLFTKELDTALAANEPEQTFDPERGVPSLRPTDTLDTALRTFDSGGHARLPVVDEVGGTTIVGWADQVQALAYFNKRLIDASEEEHR